MRHDDARTIRQAVSPAEIRRLARRSDARGLVFLAGHLAALVAGGWLVLQASPAWLVPAMFLQGVLIVHLFAPFHETSHGTAFASAWLNRAVCWLTGLALGLPPTHFRLEHLEHHAWTQDPEHDPEMIPHTATRRGYLLYATALPYFRSLFSSLARHWRGAFTPGELAFLPPHAQRLVIRDGRIMLAVYAAIALASLATGSWLAVKVWLLPRILGEPVMRLIRMSEHGGCAMLPEIFRNTRTVRTFLPWRWLNWNNAFHAEHHALPGIPFHALPELHARIGPHLGEVTDGYVEAQRVILARAG